MLAHCNPISNEFWSNAFESQDFNRDEPNTPFKSLNDKPIDRSIGVLSIQIEISIDQLRLDKFGAKCSHRSCVMALQFNCACIPQLYAYTWSVLWFGDRQILLPLIYLFFFYLLTTLLRFFLSFFLFRSLYFWISVKSFGYSQNILWNNERKLVSFWSSFYWPYVFFVSLLLLHLVTSCLLKEKSKEKKKNTAKKLNASNLLPIFVINFVILFSDMNMCVCIDTHFFFLLFIVFVLCSPIPKLQNNHNNHNIKKNVRIFRVNYLFEWTKFSLL